MRPAVALIVAFAFLPAAVATAAPAAAARSLGLIIDTSPVEHPVPFVRFADLLVEALAGSRRWEPTVLLPDSPMLRISQAAWPEPIKGEWMANGEALMALLVATRLDDLLVIKPIPALTNDLEILWLRQGESQIRRLHLAVAGAGDQAYTALSRQLLTRLDEGPQAAQIAERIVTTPGTTPPAAAAPPVTAPAVTPPATPPAVAAVPATAAPPALPGAPATSGPPATGSAVDVGHEAEPATAPKPPTGTTPAGVDLTKPTTGTTLPGATPAQPEAPPVQPGTAAPAPVTPAGPTPAPPATTPPAATTAPAVTPPQAPAPAGPSVYLTAAQKYLREGDFPKVEDMLVQAQGAGDSRAQIYALWAELEKARQNPAAERTWLQRALAENAALTPAHLRLAELLRQAGLWHKAADEYEIVLKAEPANLHAYLGLSALYAGQSQPRRAAEILAGAVKHYPQDPSLYLRLGDLYAQRQAWAEAENAYDEAVRLTAGPRRADALDRLGDLYVSAGREREGFICYAEASKLRAGGASTMAEKRYQQIMQAADEALLKASTRSREALQGYLSGQDVYREDVWLAFNDFRVQIKEVSDFAVSVMPPGSMKLAHAERKLAYSLAAEAALAVLEYLDKGLPAKLSVYDERMNEALQTLQRLQRGRTA